MLFGIEDLLFEDSAVIFSDILSEMFKLDNSVENQVISEQRCKLGANC